MTSRTANPLLVQNWTERLSAVEAYTLSLHDALPIGIPLLAGRTFDRADGRQHWNEAIVSRATAAYFWKDSTGRAAVGKRFQTLPGGPWYTVIGVAGATRDTALQAPPSAAVYFPQVVYTDTLFGMMQRTMAVVVRAAGDPGVVSRSVQRLVRELDPTLPVFNARSMEEVMSRSMAQLSFTMVVLGVAAGVTLLLGAIGLYGVVAYVVSMRTREFGVRIALGSPPRAVARMVARQGVAITGIGITAGLLVFALLARFLRSLLFEVAPWDPLTLAVVAAALFAVAALASWIPARRAARLDPMEALRAE